MKRCGVACSALALEKKMGQTDRQTLTDRHQTAALRLALWTRRRGQRNIYRVLSFVYRLRWKSRSSSYQWC